MTDKELAAAADAAFRATTISYQDWQRRTQQGKYPDVTKTKWWQGFDALGKIGATPPPPPPVGTPHPTSAVKLTPNYYASQDGPDANYQSCWIGSSPTAYTIDRLASDTFWGALLWKPKSPWPNRPAAGAWGRVWNFHNTADDNTAGYGWSLPPGTSAFALDFYDGNLILNVEPTTPNNYTLLANVPLDRRYTICLDVVWGRTDGTTLQPGSVKAWVDGQLKLDLPACNTMYKWANGQIQHKMMVWAGHYTQAIQNGTTLQFEIAQPWQGTNKAQALAAAGGTAGEWALSDIPIPGKDHSLGPAVCQPITAWTTADLLLP